jgi:hypothetical protein
MSEVGCGIAYLYKDRFVHVFGASGSEVWIGYTEGKMNMWEESKKSRWKKAPESLSLPGTTSYICIADQSKL